MMDEYPRLGSQRRLFTWRARGVTGKVLAIAATVLVAVSALALSLIVLAILLAAMLVFGGYVWWKTRALRKQMQSMPSRTPNPRSQGDVIEGEVISRSIRPE